MVCWGVVELLRGEVIGWQDRHNVASYTKVRQAPLWLVSHVISVPYHTISHHHHAISWWVNPLQSLLDRSFHGICQVSITFFSSCDPFLLYFIILFLTLCHMPLSLLIFGLIPFPWRHFSFVFADSFVLMTHFISLTILPIVLTLLLAFVLIAVLFMVRTFVEFCHGHSFGT